MGGRQKKEKERDRGFVVHSHVESQSTTSLSQLVLASYGLWNPVQTLTEKDHYLDLLFSVYACLTNSLPEGLPATLPFPEF